MPEWTRSDGETVIVHISDLHFGTANQTHCWDTLVTFLRNTVQPALILVTGDIVDTPDRGLYEQAKKALDNLRVPYYVCPGNHDRHFRGNVSRWFSRIRGRGDTASVFDQVFIDHIVSPNRLVKQKIGTRWEIGLVGVDSSAEAKFFARGYVNPELFQRLEATTKSDTDPDLVILLTHHHLQAIRKLESDHKESIKDLAALTQMVNSGSFLECLTRAHVDIVLHGHEHAWHWAKYGSLERGKGEVCVIGAGSGTGNSATSGCSLDRSSFNAISISPDRSMSLKVGYFEGGAWAVRENVPLFNATDARRLRLLRRAGKLNADLNGYVTKHVEYTRERDAVVRWVFRNWKLKSKRFEHVVYNSTGRPVNAVLKVELPNGKGSTFSFNFIKHPAKDYFWYVAADIDEVYVDTLVNIEFTFVWLGGGLLLDHEMSAVTKSSAPGLLRRDGFEFCYVFASGPVAFANLQVTLPPEYEPREGVEVRVYDQDENEIPDEARELKERLLVLGRGRYSLMVTYPRENWWYVLAWRPVSRSAFSPAETRFRSAARANGKVLLEEFQKCLPTAAFKESARLSLYLISANGTGERAAHCDPPNGPRIAGLATRFAERGDLSPLGQAAWGVAASLKRPDSETAQELGFAADEAALLMLPVRFGLGWTSPPPWAVVRVGITSSEVADELPSPEVLEAMLAPSITGLLTAALNQH
jgi:UDP-2,3-diacylglucosamine pyrophosphatase LpxH